MNKNDMIWTTKGGKKIPIKNMSNSHLLNTHRFLTERLIETENFQHNAYILAPLEDTISYGDFEDALEDSYKVHGDIAVLVNTFTQEIERRGFESLEPRVKADRLKIKSIEHLEHGKIVEFEK